MKIKVRYSFSVGSDLFKYRAACWVWFPLEELSGFGTDSFEEAKTDLIRLVKLWMLKPKNPRPEKVIVLL